jgi:hypothetical protein
MRLRYCITLTVIIHAWGLAFENITNFLLVLFDRASILKLSKSPIRVWLEIIVKKWEASEKTLLNLK